MVTVPNLPIGDNPNRIINGLPSVNQRGAQTGMIGNGTGYPADRFRDSALGSAAVYSGAIVDGYIEMDITTADASSGAYLGLRQAIEGYNVADFKIGTADAATVTLSFKHKHTKTGVYSIAFANGLFDRAYTTEYTQTVSDVEETATITLTLDTAGTWATDNSIGLQVWFTMGGATSTGLNTSTLDTWQSGDLRASANQVNGMDSTDNYFRIKEVQLVVGSSAPDFPWEDYGETLRKCQRYYWQSESGAGTYGQYYMSAYAASAGYRANIYVNYPVTMRAVAQPTIHGSWHLSNAASVACFSYGAHGATITTTSSANGIFEGYVNSGDDYLSVNAEL